MADDQKISGYEAAVSIADTDLLDVSQDITTIPISRAMSLAQLRDSYLAHTFLNSSGLQTGGVLSVNGGDNTKFDLSAGTGVIYDYWTTPGTPVVYNVSWSAFTAQTVTNLATQTVTHVFVDKNGNIIQTNTTPTNVQRREYIYIGQLGHANFTNVAGVINSPEYFYNKGAQLADFEREIGVINNGLAIGPNGANLNLDLTGGILTSLGAGYTTDIQSPNNATITSDTAITFRLRTQTGLGSSSSTLDVGNYDDNGTVTAVSGTKAQNFRVYALVNGNIVIQYGQQLYNNLPLAVAAVQRESFVTLQNVEENGVLIGVISVLSTATDLSNDNQAKFISVSKFGETVGGVAGISITNLQQAYNNSITPELETNSTLGAFTIKDGTGVGTNNIIEILSNADVTVFSVNGDGDLFLNSSTVNQIAAFDASKNLISLDTATYPSLTELTYVKGVTSTIQTQLNGKEPTLTKGNLTGTANQITVTNGTGAVIGSGTSLSLPQDIATSSSPTFNDLTLNGSLTVTGDLTVNGTTVTQNVEEVLVEDNFLTLNYGESGAGVTAGFSGLEIDRGTATNYGIIFDETSDTFRVGEYEGMTDSTQAVATREDSPTDGGVAVWNNSASRFDTTLSPTLTNLTVTDITNSVTGLRFYASAASANDINPDGDDVVTTIYAFGGTGFITFDDGQILYNSAFHEFDGPASFLSGISGDGANITNLNAGNISTGTLPVARGGTGLATVATDRLLTGNGTSALTAEANLTFTGSLLTVTGSVYTTATGTFLGGSAGANTSNIILQHPGAISASNIQHVISVRSNDQDILWYAYNGSAFKNYLLYSYSTDTITLGALLNVGSGLANNAISLDATSHNRIEWGVNGVAAPGSASVGVKLKLYGADGAMNTTDYAIGVESSFLWFNTASGFKWYANSSTVPLTLTSTLLTLTGHQDTTYTYSTANTDNIDAMRTTFNLSSNDTSGSMTRGAHRIVVTDTGTYGPATSGQTRQTFGGYAAVDVTGVTTNGNPHTRNVYGYLATVVNTGAVTGGSGVRNSYALYGSAVGDTNGSSTAIGVYGNASGADTNWAGYFVGGNVYITNKLAVNTISPGAQVEIQVGSTAAVAALLLDQDDEDQATVIFQGYETANAPDSEIGTITTYSPDDANWSNAGHIYTTINGTDAWITYRTYCVTGDTLIDIESGKRRIDQMKVGDTVIGWDNTRKVPMRANVKEIEVHVNTDHYYLINEELKITGNHKVIVNGDWREVRRINVGDSMLGISGPIRVNSIRYVDNINTTTYNLKLDNLEKNYFANGYCIHNAKCPRIDAWIDGRWVEVGRAIMYLNGKESEGQWDIILSQPATRFRMVEDEPEVSYVKWIKGDGIDWGLGEVETLPASYFGATDGSVHEFQFPKPVAKLETFGYYVPVYDIDVCSTQSINNEGLHYDRYN